MTDVQYKVIVSPYRHEFEQSINHWAEEGYLVDSTSFSYEATHGFKALLVKRP